MSTILDKFKAQSSSKNLLSKIKEQSTKKTDYSDDRLWSYQKDKDGNANATIRFLPNKNPEDIPYAERWEHYFQHAGKWYIGPCPTTKGINGKQIGDCVICEKNSE